MDGNFVSKIFSNQQRVLGYTISQELSRKNYIDVINMYW